MYSSGWLNTTQNLTSLRFYCGGLSLSLLSLSIISLTHIHRKIPNQRFRKCFRLVFRAFVAIVILLLPLAHMNSLQLIATTTSLIVCVLVVELIGVGCWGENMFWERSCGRDKTTYSARCGVKREELEKSMKEGTVLKVEEIAKREGGEKGGVAAVWAVVEDGYHGKDTLFPIVNLIWSSSLIEAQAIRLVRSTYRAHVILQPHRRLLRMPNRTSRIIWQNIRPLMYIWVVHANVAQQSLCLNKKVLSRAKNAHHTLKTP
jgi:hypothetical protein